MKTIIHNGKLNIIFSGYRMLFGFRRQLQIPLQDILKIRRVEEVPIYKGIRQLGINLPGIIVAGTFKHVTRKESEFWNVCNSSKAVEIFIKNNAYSRIVLDIENPQNFIDTILSNVDSPELINGNYLAHEEEVILSAKDRTFGGTIAFPNQQDKFPGILFIPGSGATDRNWNSPKLPGRNGSGALLAHELAQHNLVTLRYDKTGTEKNPLPLKLSWEDYHAEQDAALRYLSAHPLVQADDVSLLGHSEGALHALHFVEVSELQPYKLILLSPPGRTLREILFDQVTVQLRTLQIYSNETIENNLRLVSKAFDAIVQGEEPTLNPAELIFPVRKIYNLFSKESIRSYTAKILDYDPKVAICNVRQPILIAVGEEDKQTDVEKDAVALFNSARASGKENIELVVLPNADHVFKYERTSRDKLPALSGLGYNTSDRFLNYYLVERITDWFRTLKHAPDLRPYQRI
jgi:uncharacterized protein